MNGFKVEIQKPMLDDSDEPHLSCNYSNWSATIAPRSIMWIKRYSSLEFRKEYQIFIFDKQTALRVKSVHINSRDLILLITFAVQGAMLFIQHRADRFRSSTDGANDDVIRSKRYGEL